MNEFMEVLKYNSLNGRALYLIAESYQKAGKSNDALEYYQRAQQNDYYRVYSLHSQARIHALEKDYQNALKCARQAVNFEDSEANRSFYNQIKKLAL